MLSFVKKSICLITVIALLFPVQGAFADPCGMVPPIAVSGNPNKYLTRVGEQLTYIFHKDGIADMVLQPAFEGKVDNFGMLIPFPAPPAIRKVSDDIFAQVENTVNPPVLDVNLWIPPPRSVLRGGRSALTSAEIPDDAKLNKNVVRVLNEEAVGMYQVAVLEAGSSAALQGWMTKNQYMFPEGMADVVDDYVDMRWIFVAVKAKVGDTAGVAPRAGIQSVDHSMPEGATFEGKVQAMAFRYRSEDLTIPMRLASYNAGELKNTVYLLTEQPVRISQLPDAMVKQQVTGDQIFKHLTEMLPATYHYHKERKTKTIKTECGEMPDLTKEENPYDESWHWQKRDPEKYNGQMKSLIAADLYAARESQLSLSFEERSKALLNISEDLGMRGEDIDALIAAVIAEERDQLLTDVLEDLKTMTFTVIKDDFPRETLRESNLIVSQFKMTESQPPKQGSLPSTLPVSLLLLFAGLGICAVIYRRNATTLEN